MWQELIVGGCIVTASLFLLQRFWPARKRTNTGDGCQSCSGCGSTKSCRL